MGANPYLFNIANEAELTSILSHYDSTYVFDVVDYAIQNRYNPSTVVQQPNVVAAWEQHFMQTKEYYNFPEFINRIEEVRIATYKEIIIRICTSFNLNFTIEDEVDWYSAAYFLYDLFVSGFNKYMIEFFSKYIYKEKSYIYDSMGLAALKKNKDSSTAYGKRLYKDIKLIVINANIDKVIENLCGIDIDLGSIITTIFPRDKANYIASLVSSKGDFYREYYVQLLHTPIRPVVLTEIRFGLQNLSRANDGLNVEGHDPSNDA